MIPMTEIEAILYYSVFKYNNFVQQYNIDIKAPLCKPTINAK